MYGTWFSMSNLYTIEITPSTEIIAASPYSISAVLMSKMAHSSLIHGDSYHGQIDTKTGTLHLLQCEYDFDEEVFYLGGSKYNELTFPQAEEDTYEDNIELLWPQSAIRRRLEREDSQNTDSEEEKNSKPKSEDEETEEDTVEEPDKTACKITNTLYTTLSDDYYTYDSNANRLSINLSETFEATTFILTSAITLTGEVISVKTGTIEVQQGTGEPST